MPQCEGTCGQEGVPLSSGVWLSRPVVDEEGRIQRVHGKVLREKKFFCRNDSIIELTPQLERSEKAVIKLSNTWRDAVELSDLATYDPDKEERGGRLLTVWFVHGRGDIMRALSMMHHLEAEMKLRISQVMFGELYDGGLFAGATQVRRTMVRSQLNALPEQFAIIQNAQEEIDAARAAEVDIPSGPGIEFSRASKEAYRLLRQIVNEIGTAYLGRLKDTLKPRSRQVLIALKGRAFAKQGEEAIESVEEVPVEEGLDIEVVTGEGSEPSTTTIANLPDEVRIIKPGKRIAAPKKEQDRAKKLLKKHGGVIMAAKFDEDAPLSGKELERALETAAANGGPRVSRRGKKREEKTTA